MTPTGQQRLAADEGCSLKLYYDTHKIPSIGIGRNLQANGIRQSEADFMFANDVEDFETALKAYAWFTALDLIRQDAITNVAFNLGVGGLLSFKRMIAALTVQDYDTAANELLNSNVARELSQRYGRLATALRTGAF